MCAIAGQIKQTRNQLNNQGEGLVSERQQAGNTCSLHITVTDMNPIRFHTRSIYAFSHGGYLVSSPNI